MQNLTLSFIFFGRGRGVGGGLFKCFFRGRARGQKNPKLRTYDRNTYTITDVLNSVRTDIFFVSEYRGGEGSYDS